MRSRYAALAAALLLTGCSAGTTQRSTVALGRERRFAAGAEQLPGRQRYSQVPVQRRLPLPFAFGDWDGDGADEAAVLYTSDAAGSNVSLAVLEPAGENSWQVSQTVEGLSQRGWRLSLPPTCGTPPASRSWAGYGSAQGDRYLVVSSTTVRPLSTIISNRYTEMVLGGLHRPRATPRIWCWRCPLIPSTAAVTLQLLTNVEGEFRSYPDPEPGGRNVQRLRRAACGPGQRQRHVPGDGRSGSAPATWPSDIILYDGETGFLQPYHPPGLADLQRSTLRSHTELLSRDIDGNATIDIPVELSDGGTLQNAADKSLVFLLWQDYTTLEGGNQSFGIYDSKNNFYLPLPDSTCAGPS